MKKQLLLSLFVVSFTSSLFAQIKMEENHKHDREVTENFTPNNNSKAGGGWFNYGKEIEDLSSDINSYGSVIHPDSTMIDAYIDDNGDTTYYNISRHSRGQLLDPTSFNFLGNGDAEFFGVGEGFILDTIFFPYQYLRPQTQNPDKLIVQVYSTPTGITSGGFVGYPNAFYNLEYDYLNNKGKNAFQTIEYDLTVADETHPDSVRYQQFIIDPPLEMPNGGLVAATYTFVPGNTYNSGDTLATAEISSVVNPRNSFLVLYSVDMDPFTILDPYENYNQTVTNDIQYNSSAQGWNGSYYPGNGWTWGGVDGLMHQNIWFHLTGIVSSTINISTASIRLYPNPANDRINIAFDNSNDITSIRITDVTGRTVYTETIANNTNSIEVNTNLYTAGIYFCEIKGAKTNETIKFTKIK